MTATEQDKGCRMNPPVFSIHIGSTSMDSRVVCNGHDISEHVRKISLALEAGSLPVIEITAGYGVARVEIEAAIKDVTVISQTCGVERSDGVPCEAEFGHAGGHEWPDSREQYEARRA